MAVAVLLAGAPLAAAPLVAPATGAAADRVALTGVGAVQKLVLDRAALARLRTERETVIRGFPLGRRRAVDLVLSRFEPFAPAARLEIVAAAGARPLAPPDRVYFRGTVAGDDGSRVLLVAAPDRIHGFVVAGGDVFPFGPDTRGAHRSYALADVDPTLHPPPGDFCANDLDPAAVALPPAPLAMPAVAAAPGTVKQADVAIDTDQELRAKFASDEAALDYLASLAAAATAIYERDLGVRLRVSYVRLWATTDPWTATSTTGALTEFRNYWNAPANDMAGRAGPRTVAHFVSGKNVNGGVAYVDVLCNQPYGYGVSQVFGSFDLSRPSQIWDVLVFGHELGHNFGSPHSHCYSPPVDRCYAQESGCYSGTVVASRGTVMSYCHLLAGGLSNIDLLFGDVVTSRIGTSVAAAGCLVDVPASTTTSTSTSSTTSTSRTTSTSTSTTSSSTSTSTSTSRTTTTSSTSTSSTTSTSRTTTTSPSTTATTTSSTTSTSRTTSTASTSSSTSTSRTTSTSTRPSSSTTAPAPPTTSTTLSPSGDADADGVADGADACAGTPAGDLVGPSGCSVCPCDGPAGGGSWRSPVAYLRCVRAEARRRLQLATLDRHAQRVIVDTARLSSCGRSARTRCCVAAALGGPLRCRLLRTTTCAERAAAGLGFDAGPGSCRPSPCG
jgi:hypothetical protein